LHEELKEHEFQYGGRNPVTLKATFPVFICSLCGAGICDYRRERAEDLAVAEFLHEQMEGVDVPEPYLSLHAVSSHHRLQLAHTGRCGCFYCLKFFDASEIEDWIDKEQTALCPHCGIDSVLPATEEVTPEMLKAMQQVWFAPAVTKV
jgi:hypothetical protein